MSLLVLENVGVGFGGRRLFDGLDLRVGSGERIGVVGRNGSGKTTLFRLLTGELVPDAGAVRRSRRVRVGLLPQDVAALPDNSLLAFVRDSVPGRGELERRVGQAQESLDTLTPDNGATEEQLMDAAAELAEAHERLAHFESDYSEHEAARILAGLGFGADHLERSLTELSGGWRMRAVLASLLFQRPDLLLLDEPTNHLDLPTIAWFGSFLAQSRHAYMLICHDREFLNDNIRKVVSFEPEGVRQYNGDYEHYRRQRAEEEEVLRNRARNVQRQREHTERFIERFRYKESKAKAVQSRVKALERLETVQLPGEHSTLAFDFPATRRAGSQVLACSNLAKSYGDHQVFAELEVSARRSERIAIIGANGAGKTTLLKIIAGEIEPDKGVVRLGHNVDVGYYAQHHAESLHLDRSVYQEVASEAPDADVKRVRTVLGAMMFGDDAIDKPIAVLSGGEKARVALARLLIAPGNLLLMDEPTNHLDLESSEALIQSLERFEGTLLFVSHNLRFIRRLATRIWSLEQGHLEVYPGTWEEYWDHRRERERSANQLVEVATPSAPSSGGETERRSSESSSAAPTRSDRREQRREQARARAERSRKLGPLQTKVAELEREVVRLEQVQRENSLRLADPSVYEDETTRQELMEAFRHTAAALERLISDWEIKQAELDALERNLEPNADA